MSQPIEIDKNLNPSEIEKINKKLRSTIDKVSDIISSISDLTSFPKHINLGSF